jgi:hypothetical protein
MYGQPLRRWMTAPTVLVSAPSDVSKRLRLAIDQRTVGRLRAARLCGDAIFLRDDPGRYDARQRRRLLAELRRLGVFLDLSSESRAELNLGPPIAALADNWSCSVKRDGGHLPGGESA